MFIPGEKGKNGEAGLYFRCVVFHDPTECYENVCGALNVLDEREQKASVSKEQ
ncbi:hypothetical protein LDG_6604 [Legionella drancourtii LLAP12]|uniref:Uncharacterized protein n=1 Tax=Legionella drancourtii LLAP12 TaxID=658187 RepID=G9EMY4_9GAMM|nr:hypothetical protein LDG_6604 [Legionella drancourtii LLAP12]